MSARAPGTVVGIDSEAVTRWIQHRTAAAPPLTFDMVTGGRSNLTYLIEDTEGRRWVLRRPPLHTVLSSAHDVGREHRIMEALQSTPVPVPALVGCEPDIEVTGAPFFVMHFVDGLVPRDVDAVRQALPWANRAKVAVSLADTLADLHGVDVDEVGLGDLGKREDYIARQLRRWAKQLEEGSLRALPLAMEVHHRLAATIPDQGQATIVHGDYRLDNLIVGDDGTIRAVLDWELCTLGDPMADLGLLSVYWQPPGGRPLPMIPAAGVIPGFPDIEVVIDRYAARSGRDVAGLDYYVAFGYWKLAMILEGVYTRFSTGAYGDADESVETFGELVLELLELAASTAPDLGKARR